MWLQKTIISNKIIRNTHYEGSERIIIYQRQCISSQWNENSSENGDLRWTYRENSEYHAQIYLLVVYEN